MLDQQQQQQAERIKQRRKWVKLNYVNSEQTNYPGFKAFFGELPIALFPTSLSNRRAQSNFPFPSSMWPSGNVKKKTLSKGVLFSEASLSVCQPFWRQLNAIREFPPFPSLLKVCQQANWMLSKNQQIGPSLVRKKAKIHIGFSHILCMEWKRTNKLGRAIKSTFIQNFIQISKIIHRKTHIFASNFPQQKCPLHPIILPLRPSILRHIPNKNYYNLIWWKPLPFFWPALDANIFADPPTIWPPPTIKKSIRRRVIAPKWRQLGI